MSTRKASLYTLVALCLLIFAIGYPIYSVFVANRPISGTKTKATTLTGATKLLPWNVYRKKGDDYYYTFIECDAKADASAPHTVIATFSGSDPSRSFSTEITFTSKAKKIGIAKIAGFDAKSVSDTSAGNVLLEMGSEDINCNTSIYHTRTKNSQLFTTKDTTNASIAFTPEEEVLINEEVPQIIDGVASDKTVIVSPVLYVQNLSAVTATLSMETFKVNESRKTEKFTFSNGTETLNIKPMSFVTIPVNSDAHTFYQLKMIAKEGNEKINFISFIEYPVREDMTLVDGHLLRRYIQAQPQDALHTIILPYSRENDFVTSISCKSNARNTVKATFINGDGEEFIGLYKHSTKTTRRILESPNTNFTKFIKKRTAGIVKLDIPNNETTCSSIIRITNTTDQHELFEGDVSYRSAHFINNKDVFNGVDSATLYVYNLTNKETKLKFYRFSKEGELLSDSSEELTLPPYGKSSLPVLDVNESRTYHLISKTSGSRFISLIEYRLNGELKSFKPLDVFITSKAIDASSTVVVANTGAYPTKVDYLAYDENKEAVAGGSHYIAGYGQRVFNFNDVVSAHTSAKSIVLQPYLSTSYPIECDAFGECAPSKPLQVVGEVLSGGNIMPLVGSSYDPNDVSNKPLLYPIFDKEVHRDDVGYGDDMVMEGTANAAMDNGRVVYKYPPHYVSFEKAEALGEISEFGVDYLDDPIEIDDTDRKMFQELGEEIYTTDKEISNECPINDNKKECYIGIYFDFENSWKGKKFSCDAQTKEECQNLPYTENTRCIWSNGKCVNEWFARVKSGDNNAVYIPISSIYPNGRKPVVNGCCKEDGKKDEDGDCVDDDIDYECLAKEYTKAFYSKIKDVIEGCDSVDIKIAQHGNPANLAIDLGIVKELLCEAQIEYAKIYDLACATMNYAVTDNDLYDNSELYRRIIEDIEEQIKTCVGDNREAAYEIVGSSVYDVISKTVKNIDDAWRMICGGEIINRTCEEKYCGWNLTHSLTWKSGESNPTVNYTSCSDNIGKPCTIEHTGDIHGWSAGYIPCKDSGDESVRCLCCYRPNMYSNSEIGVYHEMDYGSSSCVCYDSEICPEEQIFNRCIYPAKNDKGQVINYQPRVYWCHNFKKVKLPLCSIVKGSRCEGAVSEFSYCIDDHFQVHRMTCEGSWLSGWKWNIDSKIIPYNPKENCPLSYDNRITSDAFPSAFFSDCVASGVYGDDRLHQCRLCTVADKSDGSQGDTGPIHPDGSQAMFYSEYGIPDHTVSCKNGGEIIVKYAYKRQSAEEQCLDGYSICPNDGLEDCSAWNSSEDGPCPNTLGDTYGFCCNQVGDYLGTHHNQLAELK